jgi:hypothetical protein
MTAQLLQLGDIMVNAPSSWRDVTELIETSNAPYTLGRESGGMGALQFSTALHESGLPPSTSAAALLRMVEDFGKARGLGPSFNGFADAGPPLIGAASFHSGEDFVRVWYVSDGTNFAMVTYVCTWGDEPHELHDCEAIVKSVRFRTHGGRSHASGEPAPN